MDKTPKESRNGTSRFWRSNMKHLPASNNSLNSTDNNRLASKNEITDGKRTDKLLDDLSAAEVENERSISTPVTNFNRLLKYSSLYMSPILNENSPELRVEWNDGLSTADTISPISRVMSRTRTRKCPEHLLARGIKSMPASYSNSPNARESDDDISEYIEWAKSLLELSGTVTNKEEVSDGCYIGTADKKDLFNDSENEIMFMCTQKAEEIFAGSTPKRPTTYRNKKHVLTPNSNAPNQKRIKLNNNNEQVAMPSSTIILNTRSLLEEESEIFDSLDFNYLDSLENQSHEPVTNKSHITMSMTYIHNEIENRHTEGKKRLLFKCRNKTL